MSAVWTVWSECRTKVREGGIVMVQRRDWGFGTNDGRNTMPRGYDT